MKLAISIEYDTGNLSRPNSRSIIGSTPYV
jgi:hypothetical protein